MTDGDARSFNSARSHRFSVWQPDDDVRARLRTIKALSTFN